MNDFVVVLTSEGLTSSNMVVEDMTLDSLIVYMNF